MLLKDLKSDDILYNIWIHFSGRYNYAIYKIIHVNAENYKYIRVFVNILVSDWFEQNTTDFIFENGFSELNKFHIIRSNTISNYDDYYTVNEKLFTELLEKCESNKDILNEKIDEFYELYS